MIEVKNLLLKFNNLFFLKNLEINIIQKIIFDVVNLKINKEDIKIKNNLIYLNIKPIYKNEILFKKDLILIKLEKILNKKSPKNII